MHSYKWTAVLIAVPIMALACAAPAQPTGSQSESSGPKAGGIVKMRHSLDPYDWDITYTGKGIGNREGRSVTTDSLLAFKTGPGVGYNEAVIQPNLAERWEVSSDATTYTFHLRSGIKWHDMPPVSGRALTSADVKFSFEYLSRTGPFSKLPEANTGWMFEGMDRIDTPDANTVIVHFKEPFAPFLNYVAHSFVYIAPHEVYEADGHLKDRLIGTGAYYLDEGASQKGTRWVFKKNPAYWDAPRPYINEVQMIILPDDGSASAAFQTKQIDWIERLESQQSIELKAKTPDAIAYEFTNQPVHVYMNNSRPPFDNIKVRKAAFLAVNRDEFIKVMSGGKGEYAVAGVPSGFLKPDEIKPLVKYDPDEAKRLLAEAGYPNGVTADIHYPTDAGQSYITHMELLQSQLKKAGINALAKPLPYSQFSPLRKRGEHNLEVTGKDIVADADSYLFATFHPSSASNYDRVNDPKLNELLVAERREPNPEKRRDIIKQAVSYLSTECYCGLALYSPADFQLWQPYLKNYAPNWYQNGGWAIRNSWLEK